MATKKAIRVREPIDSDWPAVARLFNLDSDETISAEEAKRRYDDFPAEGRRLYLVLEGPSGEPIGVGRANHRPNNGEGVYYAGLEVDPAFRGQGYGSALYGEVEAFLEAEQARVTTFFVRETHEPSIRFAMNRGYIMERVLAESKLDLTTFDLEAWSSKVNPDVEVLTLTDLGDTESTWRELHRLATVSDDAPDADLWGALNYEDYMNATRQSEMFVPNGVIAARIDGAFAGVHTIGPIKDSTGWTVDYTGVLPEFRRRGVALALKVFGHRQAMAAGATWIMTHNDSSNAGMLAINQALGFVPQPGYAQMRKRVER